MVPVGASTEDIARTFVSSTSRAMLFGAGLSASELPQFGQLFESSLSALAASDAQMVGFADLLTDTAAAGCSKRPRPEEFFAAVEAEAPGAGLSLAQSAYSTGNPGPAHYMAVEVSRHSDAPILTTNFDTLLEAAAGDAAVEVRHLHGTTEDRSSIAVAVNNVAGHNARRVRRFAGSVLRGSVVLVAGYQGLDSDVFPLLNEADHLLWLVFADPTADPVVLASQRFPHLAHLRNRVTVFCDDVQGVLAAIAAADGYTPPCPPPAVSSVTPDWESAVRQWAAGLAPLKRRLVIARLLSHAGHFEESGALYEAITTEARGSRKPQEEAAAIAGTVRVVGSSLGDYDAARKGLDRLMTLSALPGIRGRTSLISALLNTMEAAAVVGVRFPRARYVAALLPPWTSGDYARGGKLIRQAAARLMRRRRRLMSRALFRAALLLAAWRGDFEEGVVVRWYQALSDVEIGMYDRAYGRLSAIPPTDLDFVGVTFRFWFDWLLREFDRLGIRGEPPIPKYGANLPPNPGASLLDDVSRLSTARLNG
ncbi:MAG: hypothetical protein KJ747_04535, partial [Actinobacteria bacterium]|nr:hypothetical protein [Actinomycetota bacterium]